MPPTLATTFGHFASVGDRRLPGGEHLVAASGVRADADRPAEVVEDDRRVGERPREVGQVGDVRVVDPALERHAVLAQVRVALAGTPGRAAHGPGDRPAGWERPCGPPTPRDDGCRESAGGSPRSAPRAPAATRSPSRRSALPTMPAATRVSPYRPLALIAAMPCTNSVSPTTLNSSGPSARYIDVHSTNTVWRTLCAAHVRHELLEEVAVAGPVPEVVMGIDDRKARLERHLISQAEPILWLGTGLLGCRVRRGPASSDGGGGETANGVLPGAAEKASAVEVRHDPILQTLRADAN